MSIRVSGSRLVTFCPSTYSIVRTRPFEKSSTGRGTEIPREPLEVFVEELEILSLPAVVELLSQGPREGVDGLLELVAAADRRVAVQEGRQLLDRLEVLGDPLADLGALDLDGHPASRP